MAYTISTCLGSVDGQCLRRAALSGLDLKRALSARRGKADVEKAIRHIAACDLGCRAVQGLRCPRMPRKPSFEGYELRLGGEVVRKFRRHCKQTKLLKVFASRGWPVFIHDPLGSLLQVDPENGIRDLVYQLNRRQVSRRQIRFGCEHGGVRWKIVDGGLARSGDLSGQSSARNRQQKSHSPSAVRKSHARCR